MLSGQVSWGNWSSPATCGVERAVRKKAEEAWHDDRIVQPLFSDVRLTDQNDAGHGPALEASFHGRQARRLVLRDELGLSIARRKRDQHTRDDTGDDTHTKEATGLILMTRLQRVVRANGSHHERRCHDRSDHGVGVLREGPGAQQEGPEVGQIERAVGANAMADRVLHERVRADDEIA